jgi:hypothetical protein
MSTASPARVAKKWIQDAIKKPGRLHKHFGIPEDEDIPVAKIKGEIAKLKKKDKLSKAESSLLKALNLSLRLKKMGKVESESIYPNKIDHGYEEPISGGTDVMQDLVNDLRHEQGSSRLATILREEGLRRP